MKNIENFISYKKRLLLIFVAWRSLPPKTIMSYKQIFAIFSKNTICFVKLVTNKIKNLISHKKGYIHFRPQMSSSLQKGFGPQKWIFVIFSESTASFGKIVEYKNI